MSGAKDRPRPAICSIHACKGKATVPLKAVDGVFWFCGGCAPKYEALGYRPLGQGRLL